MSLLIALNNFISWQCLPHLSPLPVAYRVRYFPRSIIFIFLIRLLDLLFLPSQYCHLIHYAHHPDNIVQSIIPCFMVSFQIHYDHDPDTISDPLLSLPDTFTRPAIPILPISYYISDYASDVSPYFITPSTILSLDILFNSVC